MELTHKLTYNGTTTTIDEPIGFDDLQMTMKRNDYHGMGAEVSLGNLEFYGGAFNIIKTAYEANIDADVQYLIVDENSSTIYSGKVDLTTCSFLKGDYKSVKAKVGDIGVQTTFNNRADTEINLFNADSIGGESVDAMEAEVVEIPSRSTTLTNEHPKLQTPYPSAIIGNLPKNKSTYYIGVCLLDASRVETKEFGNFSTDFEFIFANSLSEALQSASPFFYPDAIDSKYTYTGTIHFTDFSGTLDFGSTGTRYYTNKIYVYNGSSKIFEGSSGSMYGQWGYVSGLASQTLAFDATKNLYIILEATASTPNQSDVNNVSLQWNWLEFNMLINIKSKVNIQTDAYPINTVAQQLASLISDNGVTALSSYYANNIRLLTTGYLVRKITGKAMNLSWRDFIKSMQAIDNIGYGFLIENGFLRLRIEEWGWFYKNDVVLTITDANSVETEILSERVITELEIGYKKYTTNDEYFSNDNPFSSRVFTNSVQAIKNNLVAESEFVADNYAIEETRRASYEKTHNEETEYDENIIIFAGAVDGQGNYSIPVGATSSTGITVPGDLYNIDITPRRMAERWKSYLRAHSLPSGDYTCSSGTINYTASINGLAENETLATARAKFKAEKITFQYPLTIAQYQAVKANPYGLISVNGVLGWILDFKYSLADGMADFVLIAKNS